MIPSNTQNVYGTTYGTTASYGGLQLQPVPSQPVPAPQPVYSTYSVTPQQYGTQQQDMNKSSQGYIVVSNENEVMDSKYPFNTPIFDSVEDMFYYKVYDTNNMHPIVKKARFVWEENGVIDASPVLIEQKDMSYGDAPKNNEEMEKLKKSIEDLAGQVNALVELQLEQHTNSDKDKQARNQPNQKKTGQNK